MQSLQESFDSAKDGSGVPAHKQNTRSSIIIKKKTKPTKMKYQSYAPPYHPSLQSSTNTTTHSAQHQLTNKLQPLQLPTLQSNYINAKMNELRNLAANANKRQKKVDDHQCGSVVESVTHSHNCNSITSSDGFDILEELDTHSNVVQIVATSGGMITHWNESFTKLIKQPSSSSSNQQDTNNLPLTIFELVDSKSLPSLYSMLAMALHNVSIVDVEDFTFVDESPEEEVDEVVGGKRKRTAAKEEDSTTSSSSSHLSITLPCKSFHGTRTRYNITVVFMNDTTSMKRSFLGILTPRRRRSTSSNSQGDDDDNSSSSSTITSCSSSGVPKVTSSSEKDTIEDDEQDTQDICKALKKEEEEEYDTNSPSCSVRQLPRDKIIRVNDKLLCRMLLGSC